MTYPGNLRKNNCHLGAEESKQVLDDFDKLKDKRTENKILISHKVNAIYLLEDCLAVAVDVP